MHFFSFQTELSFYYMGNTLFAVLQDRFDKILINLKYLRQSFDKYFSRVCLGCEKLSLYSKLTKYGCNHVILLEEFNIFDLWYTKNTKVTLPRDIGKEFGEK